MRLNSTGTCQVLDGTYYSYGQQITATYKGKMLFDSGFWSRTTCKHQAIIKSCLHGNYIELKYADFNNGIEYSIKREIDNLRYDVEKCLEKRKTKRNLDTIVQLNNKIDLLQDLLDKE